MKIAAIIFLIALSACFSASETAYTALTLIDQKTLERKRGRRAKAALYFCKHTDLLLTTVLIGNNIANICLTALVTSLTIETFGSYAVGYATGILTLTLLIFGEISPKQIAMNKSLPIALWSAIPLRVLSIILFPLIRFFRLITLIINKIFGSGSRHTLTAEGLRQVTDAAEDAGVVDSYESDLMQRAIHFSETTVKAIMTHRTEVFSLPDTMTYREAYSRIIQSGFSRIPLWHGSKENITGVLLLKDVLHRQMGAKKKDQTLLSSLAKEPTFVSESMHMDDLFSLFKHQKLKIAVVLDEYGGFSGVVTMEDIVEQLFGEIYDEQEAYQGEMIAKSSRHPGSWIIQGEMPFAMFADNFPVRPEKDGDTDGTVAGYVLDRAGDIPKKGQEIKTAVGTFRILSMTRNRLDALLFTPAKPDGEDEKE